MCAVGAAVPARVVWGDGRRGWGPWAQACCGPAHALGACRRVHCRQQTEASYCSLLLRFFCIPLGREVAARHRDAGTGRNAGSVNVNPLWYGLPPGNPFPNRLGFLSAGAGFPSQDPGWGENMRAAVCKGCKATADSECAHTQSLPVGSCVATLPALPSLNTSRTLSPAGPALIPVNSLLV